MSKKQYTLIQDGSVPSETFTDYDPDEPITGARIGDTVYFDDRAPWNQQVDQTTEEPAIKRTVHVRTGPLAIAIALVFAFINLGIESLIPTHWYVWAASSPVYILATYVWLVRRVSSSS